VFRFKRGKKGAKPSKGHLKRTGAIGGGARLNKRGLAKKERGGRGVEAIKIRQVKTALVLGVRTAR